LDASNLHESDTDTIQDIEQEYQQETMEVIEHEQNNHFVEEQQDEEIEEEYEVPSIVENHVEINEKIIIPKLDLIDDVYERIKTPEINDHDSEIISEIESLEKQPEKELFEEKNNDFDIDIDKTYSNSLNTEEISSDDTQTDSFNNMENDEACEEDNFNQNEIDAESTRLNFFPAKNFQSCK
jgi:hypothetical protein